MTAQLAFAYGAGLLSVLSPCGFVMLPAFLGFYVGDAQGDFRRARRLADGLLTGLAVSAGFSAVFGGVGLFVAIALRTVVRIVPWAAVGVGALLALVGATVLAGRQLPFSLPVDHLLSRSRAHRRAAVFGGAYAVASLSCTLAVLLVVIGSSLSQSGGPLRVVAVFAAYAVGAGTILTGLSVTAAFAWTTAATGLRRLLPMVSRLGAALLIGSGVYLVWYWLPRLLGTRERSTGVVAISETVSGLLSTFVAAHQLAFAVLSVVLIVSTMTIAIRRRRRAGDEVKSSTDREVMSWRS